MNRVTTTTNRRHSARALVIATFDPRRVTRALGVATLGASLAMGGCKKEDGAKAEQPAVAAPTLIGAENIYIVANGQITTGPAISGSLTPEREATIRAQVGGSVTQITVDRGQTVTGGMLLAKIDPTGLEDALLSARSA